MCGRLPAVKGFSHVCSSVGWRQPCVRPFDAAHLAAGHNAFRGSGPGQKLAFDQAVAQVGCPDHRINLVCITCCLPFPAIPSRQCWRYSVIHRRCMLSRKRDGLLVALALGHHRPRHPGELIGKRDRRDLCWPAVQQRRQPRPVLGSMFLRIFDHGKRACTEQGPQIAVAHLGDIAEPVPPAA